MSDESELFTELGFSKNLGRIYTSALELGGTPAAAIARRAGVRRTTAYDLLDRLVSDGLITEGRKGKRRVFTAEDPEALLTLTRRRESAARRILPILSERLKARPDRPRLRYYEGVKGVRHVNEMLLAPGIFEYRYFGSVKEMVDVLGEDYLETFVKRRVARGIRSKSIRVRSHEKKELKWLRSGERWLREVRYVDHPTYADLASLYILKDRVIVTTGRDECMGLVMESRELASLLSVMWETQWQTLRAEAKTTSGPERPRRVGVGGKRR